MIGNLSRKKGPLYLQIKSILKDRILHGIYPIGNNIPSESQLEVEFHVSKITVRNAIKELVKDGYLKTKSGKGTKVIRNKSISKLPKGKRFTEVLVEYGYKIRKQLVGAEVIFNQESTEEYQLFGDQCFQIERLYYLDDVPYIYFKHYLTIKLMNIDLSDLSTQSLYDLIEEQGFYLDNFRDQFTVTIAPSLVEKKLCLNKGTHLLKRLRCSYNEMGDVIEYSKGYYNTEIQDYVVKYDT
ncbi:transcriptional regulator, GntR family [Marininema mesophilum]|uniref:Transcriptional regulator, GntR family n=1 Tax=Marininema mesophilum TaxID=1048340 RepID=A0A1H2RWB9_9BACL|nr:GntR family transcriptional regulator [Marininema mesophilum]SDW23773.1 transcriptional regulator, GntR family [Marininema mesophilum]